ncbi:glucose-inhibited division protein B [Billgrantia azerbaijanica]|nr:glucose-inhibited division protein B [Halomonas azerbaijanica]
MSDTRRRAARWGLVVGLIVAGLLLGCSGEDRPAEVPLPVLANNPGPHDGERVATQGVVRHYAEPLHYWIEDEDLHRVEILPHERIAPYLGEAVRVVGRFRFSPEKGRRLTLERVVPLAEAE